MCVVGVRHCVRQVQSSRVCISACRVCVLVDSEFDSLGSIDLL